MRTDLNLAAAESSRDHYALAWAVPATVVGLAGLVWLAAAVAWEARDYRAIQHQAAEIQQRQNQLRGEEAAIRKELEKPEYADLLRRARFVNYLIDQKQLSLSELVAEFADIMPKDAHLTGLALVPQGDNLVVRFAVTAKSEEAAEAFLSDLEDSPDFQNVTILNQGLQEAGAQPGQLTVTCTARYLPGAHK